MRGQFEARKVAWRQTKDGYYLTLEIQPHDVDQELAIAPWHTRLAIAYVEITDDPGVGVGGGEPRRAVNPLPTGFEGSNPSPPTKVVGIVQRAALLCKEPQFQEWCGYLSDEVNEAPTAAYVRHYCGVVSRSELATNREAAKRFIALEAEYQDWMKEQMVKVRKRFEDVK